MRKSTLKRERLAKDKSRECMSVYSGRMKIEGEKWVPWKWKEGKSYIGEWLRRKDNVVWEGK